MRTFCVAVALVGLVGFGTSAFADEPAKPEAIKAEAVKPYTPRSGDFELKLSDTLPLLVVIPTASGSGTSVTSSFGAGLGYCASDLVEFGAAIAFSVIAPNGGPTTTAFDFHPFLKLNFGSGDPNSRLNPYVSIAFSILASGGGGAAASNPVILVPALNPGLEIMVTRTWGINLFIPIEVLIDVSDKNAKPVIGLGLGYGVVTYF